MEKIAIVGAGNVGKALAHRFRAAGRQPFFAVRDPEGVGRGLDDDLRDIEVRPIADATTSDVVLLAVPASAAANAVRAIGPHAGTIIVDCTNPVSWNDGPVWSPPGEGSVAGALAVAFPDARLVKGFNHFGAEIHSDPGLVHGSADAFFAGDDSEAKQQVMELAERIGFRAVDAGPLRNAGLLESLAVLWIQLATVGGNGRRFGFRMEAQAQQ
jgi:NADPH-dependent F420 reductase